MRKLVGTSLSIALIFTQLSAQGADNDSLKLAHRNLMEAFSVADIDLLEDSIDTKALGLLRDGQRVIDLWKDTSVRELIPTLWAQAMKFVRTPYEVKYRVFGNTGIVCATAYDKPLPKSKERPQYDRLTYVV